MFWRKNIRNSVSTHQARFNVYVQADGKTPENEGFANAKRNEMFVRMQYFGYRRRDPDAAGFDFC